ncbi:MAG: hypothetical protein JNJ77_04565 [Planctomycetia bacterium]|nr:hypothetical protein [Planctomycetia bacterium]
MSKTNDILLIFSGGVPFSTQFKVEDEVSRQPYLDRLLQVKQARNLLAASRGAGPKIDEDIDAVMKDINSFCKSDFKTIGQVCILGRSQGCALALGLAVELNTKGVAEISFLGLSDAPMWDGGLDSPIRHVGKFEAKPIPDVNGAEGKPFGNFTLKLRPVPNGLVPTVTLDKVPVVKAGNNIQHFQTQGNHMKWARSIGRWIWFSGLSAGEVHGKVDGFDNRPFTVTGNTFSDVDLSLHVALNTGQNWKNLTSACATELARFPDPPAP